MIKFKDIRSKFSKLFSEDQQMKIVLKLSSIFCYFRKYFLAVEIDYDNEFLCNWDKIKTFSSCDRERNFNLYQYLNIHNEYFKNKETNVIEFGVSKGSSLLTIARFIKENTNIFAVDSFGEFSEDIKKFSTSIDDSHYQGSMVAFNKETRFKNFDTQTLINEIENIEDFKKNKKIKLIKCHFPNKIKQFDKENIENRMYSFCHLDFDLKISTLDALKFIFPRLEKNGILIIDDYNFINQEGCKIAVNEFGLNLKSCIQSYNGQLIYVKI